MKPRNILLAVVSVIAVSVSFGRGESWMPVPPAVATLTNEARYIEWKWRTDVTDPSIGVNNENREFELWASLKFTGPKFGLPTEDGKNRMSCDQFFLVDRGGKVFGK